MSPREGHVSPGSSDTGGATLGRASDADVAGLGRALLRNAPFLSTLITLALTTSCADGGIDETTDTSDSTSGEASDIIEIPSEFVPPTGSPVTCQGRTCGDDKGNSWTFADGVVQVGEGTPYEVVSWTRERFILRPEPDADPLRVATVLYISDSVAGSYGARIRLIGDPDEEGNIAYEMEPIESLKDLLSQAQIDVATPIRFTAPLPQADGVVTTVIEDEATDGSTLTGSAIQLQLQVPQSRLPPGMALGVTWRVTPILEFSIDSSKGTFRSVFVFNYTRTASLTLKANNFYLPSIELATLPLGDFKFVILYLPVWGKTELQINLDVDLNGQVDAAVESVKKGIIKLGVARTPSTGWALIRSQTTTSDTSTPTIRGEAAFSLELAFELRYVITVWESFELFAALQFLALEASANAKVLVANRLALSFMLNLANKIKVGVEFTDALKEFTGITDDKSFDFTFNEEFIGCWQWGAHLPPNSGWKKICGSSPCKSKCQKFADCYERECNSDGVGGSCGTCTLPKICVPRTVTSNYTGYGCKAPICASDWCGYDSLGTKKCQCTNGKVCNESTHKCETPCTPTCVANSCGSNGCDGQCECLNDTFECINEVCELKRDATCVEGTCDTDNGQGQSCPCKNGEACTNGTCLKVCQASCAAETDVCQDGVCVCVPGNECEGKWCGVDRCGRACPKQCDLGETCIEGNCYQCPPQCTVPGTNTPRVCGADTCGGSCGQCPSGQTCSADQTSCVACAPNCAGKQCGDDGCGGLCGTCPNDGMCSDGVCKERPTQDTCAGRAPLQLCHAGGRDDAFKSQSGKCYCDDYCVIAKDCCTDVCAKCGWGCGP